MAFSIEQRIYDKAARFGVGHGYAARPYPPTSGVVHTTNNRNANTLFSSEADYLYKSADVSAHFLIGKDGRIVQFLDPRQWAAWHAGEALTAWQNAHSIGVELHVSVGERPTPAQKAACAWLWLRLMDEFGFASDKIETHRRIATPAGRKSDPEGWPDSDFYQWRATLTTTAPDPWAGWGSAYPLDPAQRGYKIPQTWLRNTWLGEARSFELYMPNGQRSIQWFRSGWVVYEKASDWAMAYHASADIP